ncbi:hypothetical protein ACLI1A_08530 [Flavobacterium sp. RHBU_3]|uniref:hypothetical protein n=1 Tax=Flavobacterium sp. RHBU_3 TaxID=3391184 RepID=UPI0039851885
MHFSTATAQDKAFWDKVQYGGSIGVGIGSGYTDINLSPGAIYRFNDYIAAGPSLMGSYTYQRHWYKNTIYGGSAIVLGNPIPQIQLSAELQQLRVNQTFYYDDYGTYPGGINAGNTHRDFWNTGLFLGVGYSSNNATVGLRYNVLYNKNDYIYGDALMPFVMVYF